MVTHPWTNHEIVRMRHQERLALAHTAMLALEAREARSTKPETDNAPSTSSWLNRIRPRESGTAQTPVRTGTN